MQKLNLNSNDIVHYLDSINNYSNGLYKKNTTKYIKLKNDGNIKETLNLSLTDIISNLDNNTYYFKYAIYGQNIIIPFFAFLTKKDLKKHIHIKEIKNYRYNAFGIRFEFIDTESNRYIYIVTIS